MTPKFPSAPSQERQELRRRVLTRRDGLPAADRRRKSLAAIDRLLALPQLAGIDTFFVYVAFRSEVETRPLIARLLAGGKKVAVPLTRTSPPGLEAFRLGDPDRDLRPGYCGIPEPDPARLDRVEPAAIGAVVLPGSVFDRQGGRLGYGGGYYDRFLAGVPGALRIGLAFELQVVPAVPLESHDQRVDLLVTEEGVALSDRSDRSDSSD
ncbi:MAG: 5-formyltetrahydrofolate cyclo-ligase [Desulfobacteraceae bacterium]|nr:5-formyltetrahydrofolate cyclo-ligase [Desulfobacteraceae bacterium]